MTTSAKVSQTVRLSAIFPNPAGKVSQVERIAVINPNIPMKVSQICRICVVQAPQPTQYYCWAQQVAYPSITAVTPVLVSP